MFSKEIVEFSKNLESLRDFIDVVVTSVEEKKIEAMKSDPKAFIPFMVALNKLDPDMFDLPEGMNKKFYEDVEAFDIKLHKVDSTEGEQGQKYKLEMSDEASQNFRKSLEVINKNKTRTDSLYQNSLISVISYVEWFLAQLIHKYYDINPGAVGLKDKQLSLNDLYELGTIDDAKKYLIDSKVESIMRSSLDDWIKFLKDTVKLSMSYLDDYKNGMIESCQRRNLYVHNGGVVNSIYLKNCSFLKDVDYSVGDKLNTDLDYINETISTFEKCFTLIASELWKKNEPKSDKRFKVLFGLASNHINNERYGLAESILYFLCGDKQNTEFNLLMSKLNYWYSIKCQGSLDKIRAEIEKEDMSAKQPIFQFMKLNILSDFEGASGLVVRLIEQGYISLDEIMSNLIYKDLVDSDFFKELNIISNKN